MSGRTNSRPPSECSTKAIRTVINNTVPLPEIVAYLRAERRLSRRDAQWMAREVYRDPAVSKTNLPPGWHEAIWPSAATFVRRSPNISDPTSKEAIWNLKRRPEITERL